MTKPMRIRSTGKEYLAIDSGWFDKHVSRALGAVLKLYTGEIVRGGEAELQGKHMTEVPPGVDE